MTDGRLYNFERGHLSDILPSPQDPHLGLIRLHIAEGDEDLVVALEEVVAGIVKWLPQPLVVHKWCIINISTTYSTGGDILGHSIPRAHQGIHSEPGLGVPSL